VIPGALVVPATALGYTSMDRVLIRRDRTASKAYCGGPTGLPNTMASVLQIDHPGQEA
jgi:hypothetical protein